MNIDHNLEQELRELRDKQELTELVTRYCRATDRSDGELLLSCYHADAYDDHGKFKGAPDEFLAYLRGATMHADNTRPLQHSITNMLFEIVADVAYGETYVLTRVTQSDGTVDHGMGRYVDRFERRDGEWRIAVRLMLLEHARPGFDAADYLPGSRDRNDLSYERD